MLRSTFLGYKTANSALRVSQNLLDVVGQNMSNVNTKAYTRQRLDINSVSYSSSNIKFGNAGVMIGQGVKTSGVSQYRDAFLDLRYRTESAKSGNEKVQLDALSDLESVFDEISMDGMDAQFSDFVKKLQSLTSSPSDPVIEGVVRTSASMLCQMFNDYSQRINTVKNQQTNYLQEGGVVKVNQLMKNISSLNKQIKEDNISGNPALELNDKRNMLIDELSSYVDVDVKLTPLSIGGRKEIDILSINLKKNGMKLVDGDDFAKLEVTGAGTDTIGISVNESIDSAYANGTDLTGDIDKGKIGGYLKFLNGQGDFGTSKDKGIQYYENMLDTLASKFSEVLNKCNSSDSNPMDKPLFEARGGGDITAANLKISDAWANASESYITNSKNASASGDNSGDTENILKMISLFKPGSGTLDFKTSGGTPLFKGTMQEFFSYTATTLNLQVEDKQKSYDTYSETQFQINYARNSMSSVDLDEEGINLLTYSKSYNAAARLMTTLDEMLDTLINRMGV